MRTRFWPTQTFVNLRKETTFVLTHTLHTVVIKGYARPSVGKTVQHIIDVLKIHQESDSDHVLTMRLFRVPTGSTAISLLRCLDEELEKEFKNFTLLYTLDKWYFNFKTLGSTSLYLSFRPCGIYELAGL